MGTWLAGTRALLLDLDNTLYDWVAFFAPALRGMCRALSEMTGIPQDRLFQEFRIVFRSHGTVEYSFALQELPSIVALHPDRSGAEIVDIYRPVVDVFQQRRRAFLRPYPGVATGLATLREAGCRVFGVTDSRSFQAANRLRQLKLDGLIEGLFSVTDHFQPDEQTVARIRRFPSEYYDSRVQTRVSLPVGIRKPSPAVLDYVRGALELDPAACVYVGDSLVKDIAMAQQAGIYDCWAAYGARVSPVDFSTLVRVTDWSPDAVREALQASPETLQIFPSFAASSFDDVVGLALTEPKHRPPQQVLRLPLKQRPLFELGPAIAQAAVS